MARGWSGPNEYREIVQIGAIKVDCERLAEEADFSLLVRPIKNPQLSDYFVRLTQISQADVDAKGVTLTEALERFYQWSEGLLLYCWGIDGKTMAENAALIEVPFPFEMSRFMNIREFFKEHGVPADNYMSSTISEYFGIKPARRGHDALNDARSILDGLRGLRARIGAV